VDEGGGAVVAGRTAHLHEQVVGAWWDRPPQQKMV